MEILGPAELQRRLAQSEEKPILIDVREPWEFEICRIPGCLHIPLSLLPVRMLELKKNAPTVIVCHHGIRSLHAARLLEQNGFSKVAHLDGGISAWASDIDQDMAVY